MDYWFQKTLDESFWPSYFASVVVAFVLIPILCAFPTVILLGPYVQWVALGWAVVLALITGFLCERWLPRPAAHWVWTLGIIWLAVAAYNLGTSLGASAVHQSRWQYLFDQLFRDCGASECMYLAFFTYPSGCAFIFSLGAGFGLKRARRSTPRPNSFET